MLRACLSAEGGWHTPKRIATPTPRQPPWRVGAIRVARLTGICPAGNKAFCGSNFDGRKEFPTTLRVGHTGCVVFLQSSANERAPSAGERLGPDGQQCLGVSRCVRLLGDQAPNACSTRANSAMKAPLTATALQYTCTMVHSRNLSLRPPLHVRRISREICDGRHSLS